MIYKATEKVHFAIVLGPNSTSLSGARARVLLELDSLFVPPTVKLAKIPPNNIAHNGNLKENVHTSVFKVRGPLKDNVDSQPLRVLKQSLLTKFIPFTSEREDDEDPPLSEYGSDTSDEDSEIGDSENHNNEAVLKGVERLLLRTLANANANPDLGIGEDLRKFSLLIFNFENVHNVFWTGQSHSRSNADKRFTSRTAPFCSSKLGTSTEHDTRHGSCSPCIQ